MKRGLHQDGNRNRAAQTDRPPPAAVAVELPAAFANDIEGFIGFLQLERGLSPRTVEGYESDLRQCGRFLARKGGRGWPAVEPAQLSD
ncbi:MAG: site-specific integrase, partial [Opitutaceae bacterium]